MTAWSAVIVPILSAIFGAAVGGLIVHRLALRRELLGERRARRVDHLIGAWRAIMAMANRTGSTPSSAAQREAFERALTDIMLLGEAAEVEATAAFIKAMGANEPTDLDAVVSTLRHSLRMELQLGNVALPHNRVLRIDWGDE